MQLDVVTAITATVAVLGFIIALATYVRGGKKNIQEEAKENAENAGIVLTRLNSIDDGIRDIKAESRAMRTEIQQVRDIAQHANERAESAHSRLDRAGIDTH